MWGAVVGDCIGSAWEFGGNKNPNILLWRPDAAFTDDTVCTAAVADWALAGAPPNDLAARLHAAGRAHLDRGFAPRMRAWLRSDTPTPYGSWGNGAAMRVSPVALLAPDEATALAWAEESVQPTHNHPESVRGAQAAVWAIRHAFAHRDGARLLTEAQERFGYPHLTARDPNRERAGHVFDVSVMGTVPLALVIAARAGSFREALRTCCSMGGDADTLGAIAGPIAEGLYGVPLEDWAAARTRFGVILQGGPSDTVPVAPDDWSAAALWSRIAALYTHPTARANLTAWGRSSGTVLPEGTAVDPAPLPDQGGGVRSRLKGNPTRSADGSVATDGADEQSAPAPVPSKR